MYPNCLNVFYEKQSEAWANLSPFGTQTVKIKNKDVVHKDSQLLAPDPQDKRSVFIGVPGPDECPDLVLRPDTLWSAFWSLNLSIFKQIFIYTT